MDVWENLRVIDRIGNSVGVTFSQDIYLKKDQNRVIRYSCMSFLMGQKIFHAICPLSRDITFQWIGNRQPGSGCVDVKDPETVLNIAFIHVFSYLSGPKSRKAKITLKRKETNEDISLFWRAGQSPIFHLFFLNLFFKSGSGSRSGCRFNESLYSTVKFHFVTIKHVVLSFKLQFYFRQPMFIFKIIKHWLFLHNPMLPCENLVFESF